MSNFEKLKNNIKDDAKELYKEGRENTSAAYNSMKDKTESVVDQVKDAACDMYEEGKKKINQAEDMVCKYSDDLVEKIKDQPLTSVLMAVGVGFVLSKLLKK